MRAIAVLVVIGFHAGIPGFGGGYVGVDVFFVVSGFLITGLLLREVERTGRVDLPRFWARRVRRLLPAASLTLVAIAVLTVVVLPVTRWAAIAGDILFSAFYVVNWRLADRSVDYLAADHAASPVQHFWSLAVEEQFYVLWPVLIMVLAWIAARLAARLRTLPLAAGIGLLGLGSLGWSVYLTAVDAGRAYFVTTTRLWELALGGMLAVAAPLLMRLGRGTRVVLGWGGMVAIGYAVLTYSLTTPFPGWVALIPTLGAAAVIGAGIRRSDDGVGRLLSWSPLEQTGELSYSLYLWHWPLLVVAIFVWGDDGVLSLPVAIGVAAFSFLPAWLAFRLVERPLHRSSTLAERPLRAFAVAALCAGTVVASALAVHAALDRYGHAQEQVGNPSAQLPLPTPPPPTSDGPLTEDEAEEVDEWLTADLEHAESILPDPIDAVDDNPAVHDDGCYQNQARTDVVTCVYGDPESPHRVVLVGDSHAAHWQPALRVVAEQQGWRLETYIKSACFFGDAPVWLRRLDQEYVPCSTWNAAVMDQLLADPPGLVVAATSGEYDAVRDGARIERSPASDEILVDGLASRWSTLLDAGSQVLVLADTPWRDNDVPECVAENRPDVGACNTPRQWGVERSGIGIQTRAAGIEQRAMFVDLTDSLCTSDVCPAVISGLLTMRDRHHLTATFSQALGPALETAMLAELDGRWPADG